MVDFPSMPLWTGDYLADTQDLSAEEHGVYMLLLMAQWRTQDCTLPDDDQRLARMAKVGIKKWRKLRPVMERFFTVGDGLIWQKRLVEERRRVENQREQKREAASARWSKEKSKTPFLSASHRNATSKPAESSTGNGKPLTSHETGDAAAPAPDMRQECPPTPTPTPSPDRYSPPPVTAAASGGAGGGQAGSEESDEQAQVRQACDRIQRIVNAGHPLADLARYVRRWRDHGIDVERDIVPTVQAEMDRRQQRGEGPPGHPKYFDKPVWRAFRERTAPSPANESGSQPEDVDDIERRQRNQWRARLRGYQKYGEWMWGPEPGDVRCQVPDDVLAEFGYDRRRKEATG